MPNALVSFYAFVQPVPLQLHTTIRSALNIVLLSLTSQYVTVGLVVSSDHL